MTPVFKTELRCGHFVKPSRRHSPETVEIKRLPEMLTKHGASCLGGKPGKAMPKSEVMTPIGRGRLSLSRMRPSMSKTTAWALRGSVIGDRFQNSTFPECQVHQFFRERVSIIRSARNARCLGMTHKGSRSADLLALLEIVSETDPVREGAYVGRPVSIRAPPGGRHEGAGHWATEIAKALHRCIGRWGA